MFLACALVYGITNPKVLTYSVSSYYTTGIPIVVSNLMLKGPKKQAFIFDPPSLTKLTQ